MQFRSADPDLPLVFSTAQLRKQVPMRNGDIFDVYKLREGFDALKKLYASSGWIDFTPTPDFDIDDAAKQINLTLELDQEKQYRVGRE
jgi:outer membrane protein assembly factor BamA